MEVHGTPAVLVSLKQAFFVGKVDSQKVRRLQFPLVLAWAKTVHKSQGATETKGVMATLDGKARRTPGLAYVAISRCKRLADLHLQTFTSDCIKAPAGVQQALTILKRQQARLAHTKDKTWCSIFKPGETEEELAKDTQTPQKETEAQLRFRQLQKARDAEARGVEPTNECKVCGERFFSREALQHHASLMHDKVELGKEARPRKRLREKTTPPPPKCPPENKQQTRAEATPSLENAAERPSAHDEVARKKSRLSGPDLEEANPNKTPSNSRASQHAERSDAAPTTAQRPTLSSGPRPRWCSKQFRREDGMDWSPSARPSPGIVASLQSFQRPCGLQNMGASCFLNATLQAVMSAAPIRRAAENVLKQNPEIMEVARNIDDMEHLTLDEWLAATYGEMATEDGPVAPTLFLKRYYHGQQEDAQEFLSRSLADWELAPATADLLRGLDRPKIRCSHCGFTIEARGAEDFRMLPLPLCRASGERLSSVTEALQEYFADEMLDDDFQWRCRDASCRRHLRDRDAPLKRNQIEIAPAVLVVQLCRWGAWRQGQAEALNHQVHADRDIELQGHRYTLRAAVCHAGASANTGHYIAFVCYTSGWYLCDDARVRLASASEQETLTRDRYRDDKAYMLVYEHSESMSVDVA